MEFYIYKTKYNLETWKLIASFESDEPGTDDYLMESLYLVPEVGEYILYSEYGKEPFDRGYLIGNEKLTDRAGVYSRYDVYYAYDASDWMFLHFLDFSRVDCLTEIGGLVIKFDSDGKLVSNNFELWTCTE